MIPFTHSNRLRIAVTGALLLLAAFLAVLQLLPTLNFIALPFFVLCLVFLSGGNAQTKPSLKYLIWGVAVILGLFISIYHPENFNRPVIFSSDGFYPGGAHFTLSLNAGKALGGYLILLWLWGHSNEASSLSVKNGVLLSLAAIVCIILIANISFAVAWQFKLPRETLWFILINLGITVVAEEAFFRLIFQRYIENIKANSIYLKIIAAVVATLLFALVHTSSFGPAFLLFFIVGGIYSAVYALTGRLLLCMLLHGAVNILHFIFLEYPLTLA